MRHKYLLAYLLAAITLLPAVFSSDNKVVSFYKLSFRWPPSACNVGGLKCLPKTLGYFTIHGLWPMDLNEDDSTETEVPPYDPKKNKCTNVIPTDPKDLLRKLSSNIQAELQKYWPSYKNYENINMCAESWKHEWRYHGICSGYLADQPEQYFSAALDAAKNYNYDPLKGTKVEPREQPYKAIEIVNAVKEIVKVTPQIQCNKKDGTLQLLEIRLCFAKAKLLSTPMDCPNTFTPGGVCQQETDLIKFTPPPSTTASQPYKQNFAVEMGTNLRDYEL